MAGSNDRVEEALAAYLDHLEMGGPAPDTGHLSSSERSELEGLIDALEATTGIAFGHGLRGDTGPATRSPGGGASTEEGVALFEELRTALPPGVRIEVDADRLVPRIGGLDVIDRWLVGTFGGRVRVWLLDIDSAQVVERNADCLADLDRVFRMFPDMSGAALVGRDRSCLLVEPEDCAPQIQVPSGSLVSRRYRRSIRPVIEVLTAFLDELVPYWDPIPLFEPGSGLLVDVGAIGDDFVRAAIERQRGIGERARKGNPKKDALLALGKKEINGLTKVAKGLFDGSISPDEIEQRIERSAEER